MDWFCSVTWYERVRYYLKTGEKLPEVSLEEKYKIIKEHFLLELQEKGEYTGIREFRKHLAFYTKGLPNSSEFRSIINSLENKDMLLDELENFFTKGVYDGS